jgi:hypothetical protein
MTFRICQPSSRRHAERGSVLLITAVMIFVLVAMLALSIDLGYVLSGQGQLQNGIDSAALAGASGLRTAIESSANGPEQTSIIRQLTKDFAARNEVRRYPPIQTGDTVKYKDGLAPNPDNYIVLSDGDITPNFDAQPPRIVVRHKLDQDPSIQSGRAKGKMPTIFANIFGLNGISLSAGAVASLFPVDGGAGMLSGCWRPLLLPDTFFDASGNVWAASSSTTALPSIRAINPLPNQPGDYYRSRFHSASPTSDRGSLPFVDPAGSATLPITSIRDANVRSQIKENGGTNLMGQEVIFKDVDFRIANFAGTYSNSVRSDSTVFLQARDGICLNARVGDIVQVFSDAAEKTNLLNGLRYLLDLYPDVAFVDTLPYYYVKNDYFPKPNTHPVIIPVLFFDPLKLISEPNSSQYQITNIGVLYLTDVDIANREIRGRFLREIVLGGTPIDPSHDVAPSNYGLLPAAVRLVR